MIKIELLTYGVICEGKRLANFEDLDHAKYFANGMAINKEKGVIIINNFTGELCSEFVVKHRIEIIEVEP
jgi:hypothetical protein